MELLNMLLLLTLWTLASLPANSLPGAIRDNVSVSVSVFWQLKFQYLLHFIYHVFLRFCLKIRFFDYI